MFKTADEKPSASGLQSIMVGYLSLASWAIEGKSPICCYRFLVRQMEDLKLDKWRVKLEEQFLLIQRNDFTRKSRWLSKGSSDA